MKITIINYRKMVLLVLATVVLLIPAVRAQTVTTSLDDLVLGFYSTAPGQTSDLEVDLGSISNFYNASGSFALPALSVQDLVDTFGVNWYTSTNLFWGAVSTTGRAAGTADGHAPVGTLWATAPANSFVFNRGSVFAQKAASPNIEALIVAGAPGALDGALSTTNSPYAAVIADSATGSWSSQDQRTVGSSFGYFNPTVDNTANIPVDGQVVSDLYELQPTNAPNVAGTVLGQLILTQSGLSFDAAPEIVPEPSTWVLVGFGVGLTAMLRRSRRSGRV